MSERGLSAEILLYLLPQPHLKASEKGGFPCAAKRIGVAYDRRTLQTKLFRPGIREIMPQHDKQQR
jgi:hypothetical protein